MFDFFAQILRPLEIAVAWIMVQFHSLLTALGMPAAGGWTWALSIVGLVVVIRILLIPLFVKQINASRGMQLIQPEIRKIQLKYKDKKDPASRQAMTQETMALYKERGTNPFASCLPILLQAPIFFALFRVLNGLPGVASGTSEPIGPLSAELASEAESSTIFGAQLSDTFLNADSVNTQIVTVVLILLMSGSQFYQQRMLLMKNMPAAALDNPFAKQQKMLMYLFPIIFAVTGVNFPIGVLIYWFTTNVWSLGQQLIVIRSRPAIGSEAEAARNARLARKRAKRGDVEPVVEEAPEAPRGQRQQPKRKDRKRRPDVPAGSPASGVVGDAGGNGVADPTAGAPDADSDEAGQAGQGSSTAPASPRSGQPNGQQRQAKKQPAAKKSSSNRSRKKRPQQGTTRTQGGAPRSS